MIPFRDIDIGLIYLFERYYPEAIDYSNTHYPFGKLENDGIWEIENSSQLLRTSVGHLSKKEILDKNIKGGLYTEIYDFLVPTKEIINEIIEILLEKYFPINVHSHLKKDRGIISSKKPGKR